MNPWLVFLVGGALVILVGSKLSQYGDEVAERTGLGGAAVGVVLLALLTSFPELVIGVTSARVASPDFAVGNALGSNLYNLTIIAVADGFFATRLLLATVSRNLLLSCVLSQFVVCLAALFLFLRPGWAVGWVGVDSFLLVGSYGLCLRMLARGQEEQQDRLESIEERPEKLLHPPPDAEDRAELARELLERPLQHLSNPALYGRIAGCALVILAVGPPMVGAADALAESTGLGAGFVGSLLLAIVGSLPELAVSISAVRMGAYDMAVGNVFGSNLFNIVLLAVSDVFYTAGPLLQSASPSNLTVALYVLLLTSVLAVGLVYRSRRTFVRLGPDSWFILGGYAAAVFTLYATR